MPFLQRRIHLITGKGGVGRTVVSAALARALARQGRRVLLTEVGDPDEGASPLARQFGRDRFTDQPAALDEGLFGCQLWALTGHAGFLQSVLPAGPLIRAALRSKSLSRFLVAAPSFHEMGIFYHLLMLLETKPRFDAVVLDMPATGHALALTSLPEILLRLIPIGPVAKALRAGQAHMNDPRNAAAWVVTLPEQLPVSEALELVEGLGETAMTVGGMVLNRMPADPFSAAERAELERWLATREVLGRVGWGRLEAARRAEARLRAGAGDLPILVLPDAVDPGTALVQPLIAQMAR